jgi:CheY-like chemotaxis protein
MRILLVEDKADFAADIDRAVRLIEDCELVWVASRDSAVERLAAQHFDLVVLDRRIPTADDVLDDHQDHGWSVFQSIRENLPGTPVWFLTGTEDIDFATTMNNDFGRAADIHGREQSEPLYLVCWKRQVSDCVRRIREFATHRAGLDRIAVRIDTGTAELRVEERTVVQLFGRRYHGTSVDLSSLNGGLSRSRVLKVIVRNANNAALITAAAKISSLPDIRDEGQRYRTDISRLAPGGFPQLSMTIDAGAGNHGGLFYGMVGDTVESLFNKIAEGHAGAAEIPHEIRRIESPWCHAKRLNDVSVAQIRRKLIGDPALRSIRDQLNGIDIGEIEARIVRVAHCCQHGDLHCANVVFDRRGQPMLIDFGDVGLSFAAIDPITLELSTIFHSQHATLPAGWPTEDSMSRWVVAENFVAGCTFAPFVRACRDWALAEAGSQDEVVAVAYAYAMRQLRYHDTDKTLARALIRACIAHLVL